MLRLRFDVRVVELRPSWPAQLALFSCRPPRLLRPPQPPPTAPAPAAPAAPPEAAPVAAPPAHAPAAALRRLQ